MVIVGAGSIGTALGHVIAKKRTEPLYLLTIEEDVAEAINKSRVNPRYFPAVKLAKTLKATTDPAILREAEIVFIGIPSLVAVDYLQENRNHLNPDAILVNLAKGFSRDQRTITEVLTELFPNPAVAMKGPSFAREIINRLPTGFTIGSQVPEHRAVFRELFQDTPVDTDFSDDVRGVELLSILKNIYAIAMGIIDAHYNSPNLRFMFLTRAFNEMRNILLNFGGKQDTMFCYCGYGDFTLTALNDLSRNRTLGLLIGKGFFTRDISDKVVLEGKIAVNVFCEEISHTEQPGCSYPIISELYKLFNNDYDIQEFVNRVIRHGD